MSDRRGGSGTDPEEGRRVELPVVGTGTGAAFPIDRRQALKVILRCRLIDAQFRPFPEDVPAAIEAAENSGNIELATVLKRG